MADLDDLDNPDDEASPDEVVAAFAPKVEHTPGDVWHWLDPDLRARYEAEYWPALRADEQASAAGQQRGAVARVVEHWWHWAQICAQPGGRALLERTDRERQAGKLTTVPYDPWGDDI